MTTPAGFMRRYGLQPPALESHTPPAQEPEPRAGDMRVWWSRDGGEDSMEYHPVTSPEQAMRVIRRLTRRDLRLPVVWNAGGLELFEDDGQWHEWRNDHDRDVWELADLQGLLA